MARPVNIIVHTLEEGNRGLKRGEYFWVDIAQDGVALYELHGTALAMPQPLTAADAYEMASGYFTEWLPSIDRALATAEEQTLKGENDLVGAKTRPSRCTRLRNAPTPASCSSVAIMSRVRII